MADGSAAFVADRGDGGTRIDVVVCRHLAGDPAATRTRVQSWIREGRVTVNGGAVRRVAARVAIGDVITVRMPLASVRRAPAAEQRPVHVLYEDPHLVAIDKPAGLVIHPSYKHPGGTLLNALLWHARTWDKDQRPSLVGRLDKDTSGIVLVAKTRSVHAQLQRAMLHAAKEYVAVVYGRAIPASGRIDQPLGRDAADRRRVVATGAGRASVTEFVRVSRVAAPRAGLALLRCRLVTGRMHQIRVHLAARGWPIVGDRVYGEPRWNEIRDASLAAAVRDFPRQALHAARLLFVHPVTGAPQAVEAPLPPDIAALLAATGLRGDAGTPAGRDASREDTK